MKRLLLLFAFVLVVAACGDTSGTTLAPGSPGDGGTPEGPIASPDDLGRPWVLEEGTLDGATIELPAGHRITVNIRGDQIGGSAACNSYGGTVTVDGTSITVGEIARTLVGCVPPVMEAEEAYLAGLAAVDTIEVTADVLVLTGPGVVLSFRPVPPAPTADLVGTEWLLQSLVDGELVSSVAGEAATLLLGADGSLSGSTGCRTLTGSYVVSGDEINAVELSADGECPAELATQDGHVIEVLADGFVADVDRDRLELFSAGQEGLVYIRR